MGIIKKVKDTFFTVKYIKFFITGITAFAIDFSLFTIGIRAGLPILVANTISIGISIIANYTINRLWVWQSSEKKVGAEFGKFISVQGVNYVMNNIFLLIFVALTINNFLFLITDFISPSITTLLGFFEGEEGNKLLAKFFATAIQMVTSFLFYKFFVFKGKSDTAE